MRALRVLNLSVIALASLIGLLAFVYPFLTSELAQTAGRGDAHTQDAPLMMVALVILCLASVLATLGSGEMNSKTVAILGVLTAANAVLRAVPGPAGFAAVFALPILCGYVYGSTFGFLLGSLSILVSALIGAGVGPWLPYQMLGAGWAGLSSAWLPKLGQGTKAEVILLGFWGLFWGLLFGALMNIWFWPYVYQAQQAGMYWQPGMGLAQTLRHYAVFYAVTSFWWDLGRAAGNALLIWLFGAALLKLLRRFQRRFYWATAAPVESGE